MSLKRYLLSKYLFSKQIIRSIIRYNYTLVDPKSLMKWSHFTLRDGHDDDHPNFGNPILVVLWIFCRFSSTRRPLHYLKVKLFALRGIFLILPWSLVKVSNHWQHLSSENPCGLAGKNCRVTYNDTNNLHFGLIVEPPEHTKF